MPIPVLKSEIYKAIRSGAINDAIKLLEQSPDSLQVDTPFGSWLHIASSCGSLELVERLVGLGIDINRQGGTFGGSAINHAASEGHTEIVRFLLTCGAELDISAPERNPLFAAIQGGHIEIVKLLVNQGIDYCVRYSGQYMAEIDARLFAIEQGKRDISAYLAELLIVCETGHT